MLKLSEPPRETVGRSVSRLWKLCTAVPSFARLRAALLRTEGNGSIRSTGEARRVHPASVEATGRIVQKLKAVNDEIKDVRNQIKEAEDGRVVEILQSVPGIGTTVLAIIIAEAFDSVRQADPKALRCYFGVAPVTKRSGQTVLVQRRHVANRRLVATAYHWAMIADQRDGVSRAICHALRSQGHKHAHALRGVADRLLTVVCKMIETG